MKRVVSGFALGERAIQRAHELDALAGHEHIQRIRDHVLRRRNDARLLALPPRVGVIELIVLHAQVERVRRERHRIAHRFGVRPAQDLGQLPIVPERVDQIAGQRERMVALSVHDRVADEVHRLVRLIDERRIGRRVDVGARDDDLAAAVNQAVAVHEHGVRDDRRRVERLTGRILLDDRDRRTRDRADLLARANTRDGAAELRLRAVERRAIRQLACTFATATTRSSAGKYVRKSDVTCSRGSS